MFHRRFQLFHCACCFTVPENAAAPHFTESPKSFARVHITEAPSPGLAAASDVTGAFAAGGGGASSAGGGGGGGNLVPVQRF